MSGNMGGCSGLEAQSLTWSLPEVAGRVFLAADSLD
jgi:hypothetical protein